MGRLILLLLLVGFVGEARAGVEGWVDPHLKERDGLFAWYDVSHQGEARAVKRTAPLVPGGTLNLLFDGSGHGRHLVQRERQAQPKYHAHDGVAVLRFDGKDDRLELLGEGKSLETLSAFIVVAPRSNEGGFRGILAANTAGMRDYDTGFCIDLAPAPSTRFDAVNVEGHGFGGAVDLLGDSLSFGTPYVLEARIGLGAGGVSLWVDGRFQGRRDRKEGSLHLEDLSLGARFYTNDFRPAFTQGFFDGDVAEVLIYDHVLSDAASKSVRTYLSTKYAGLGEWLKQSQGDEGEILRTVANPPPVQMFVPGFAARDLPVQLTNINNVRYRKDGKLIALAYNGNIYVLTDKDGDGLEDDIKLFWDGRGKLRAPIGMALTLPGDRRGQGVYVACKGKCSLILDEDGDDVGDREVVVAQGWTEIKNNVDALGVAVASDGAVYFGLGTIDFTNAYLVDRQGHPHYDLKSERGAILRVAPDYKSREVVATGIRFPVALAFNRKGDLFATDQEGATWLPNGNPFDELLHIQRGRHYGFPPRHPKYLNGVIDEPSVFDYGPQHQSTCGLFFNDPTDRGKVFGPSWWSGDALVCGYSRGKLYRTKLMDTASGYVAKTDLIACLNQLTADACVSPDGALVVAAHGGGPDWGSGPEGHGRLLKVTYVDPSQPQPVLSWAESERETHIAFDRPVDPALLRGLAERATIHYGRAVAAGDRFESLRPGYEVVAAQLAAPRRSLKVQSVNLTPDRRTLVLTTAPQVAATPYAVSLPGVGGTPQGAPKGALPQEKTVELAYDLGGVQAAWKGDELGKEWSGWLPHLDLKVARELTAGSAKHDALWALLSRPGTLTLSTQLKLRDFLRPAYQPGSRVDAPFPVDEQVTIELESGSEAILRSASPPVDASRSEKGTYRISRTVQPKSGEFTRLELALRTGGEKPTSLAVSIHTNEDSRARALPLSRILMPWARLEQSQGSLARAVPSEWRGGSWLRGREVFFSEQARCSQCHTVRGQGGTLGPDLSNLVERDYASVIRDIREPNFAINPDHVTYAIALTDGRVVSGPVRTEGTTLLVGDAQGQFTPVAREEVEEIKPQSTSMMPEGLPALLGTERMRDLLTFLLQPGLEPAPIHREDAPPPRTQVEWTNLRISESKADAKTGRPLRVVLVSGPKDHGIDEHDYPSWQERWAKLLRLAPGVTVSEAQGWPSAEDFAQADVLVWYSANPGWSEEKAKDLDAFLARGGGMVYLHFAVNGKSAPKALADRIGLAWEDGRSKYRHGPLNLDFNSSREHAITAGLPKLHLVDESYWNLAGDAAEVNVLATAIEDGQPQPLLWTREQGRGRVFCSIPGHYSWTFDDPIFRLIILRAIAWTGNQPVDRFSDLALMGARIEKAKP